MSFLHCLFWEYNPWTWTTIQQLLCDVEWILHPLVLQTYFDIVLSVVYTGCFQCWASLFYGCLLYIVRLSTSLAFNFSRHMNLSLFDVKVIWKLSETLRWVWPCAAPLNAERSIIITNIKELFAVCSFCIPETSSLHIINCKLLVHYLNAEHCWCTLRKPLKNNKAVVLLLTICCLYCADE